ncbi:MAG TPA: hypothetical protein VL424_16995 [Pararobbsia sp.]|nr:hypothetical protein [Pararobbsia sp.]
MYKRLPAFVLAFHGCDRSIGERILGSSTEHLRPSLNEYDWLGNGIYFWESSPLRAYQFANEARHKRRVSKGKIRHPFVLGAVIDLGHCLNFLDASALVEMQEAYECLKARLHCNNRELPRNRLRDGSGSFLLRDLDCAVIEAMHRIRQDNGDAQYDTVRAALWEGDEVYAGAGITSKNHVQICVRDSSKIKGYFRVRDIDGFDVADWNRLGKSAYSHFHGNGTCLGPGGSARSSKSTARRRSGARPAHSGRAAAAFRAVNRDSRAWRDGFYQTIRQCGLDLDACADVVRDAIDGDQVSLHWRSKL